MKKFKIKGEYIQLNQLLKVTGWCDNGSDANAVIDNGEVKVNGEIELRKRNKLVPGSKVQFNGKVLIVE